MAEDKLELELDVNTKKAKETIDKIASSIASKEIQIKINKNSMRRLRSELAKFNGSLRSINVGNDSYSSKFNQYKDLIANTATLDSEVKKMKKGLADVINMFSQVGTENIDSIANSVRSLSTDIKKIPPLNLQIKSIESSEFYQVVDEIFKGTIKASEAVELLNNKIFVLYDGFKRIEVSSHEFFNTMSGLWANSEKMLESLSQAPIIFSNGLAQLNTSLKQFLGIIYLLRNAWNDTKTEFSDSMGLVTSTARNATSGVMLIEANAREIPNRLETFKEKLFQFGRSVSEIFKRAGSAIKSFVSGIGETLAKKLSDDTDKAFKTINKAPNQFFSNLSTGVGILKEKMSGLVNTGKNVASSLNQAFSSVGRSASNASNHVDEFSRRIFRLLRNAFVFNVISRGFRGLSDTLYNLIRRDTQLSQSLLFVKANLIRAFAPIWQVVLPWIRALGRALVWLSNRLISFINYLAGREIIKPVKEIGEAQKVVSNFMKIASPKKEMFDLEKPAKKTKKLKDNTKKAAKESNKLLASFDKLETLKFKKNGFAKDPFGLEELKKDKNGKDILNKGSANLEVEADTESIEQQIARAINQIEDQPLEFKVNDNIGEQITSEVNGLNLPTLDFKVDTDNNKLDDLKLKLNLVKDAIIGIATAATVYKVVSVLGNIVGIGASMIGPAGWLSLAAGLGVGLALAFKDMDKYLKDADGNLTPFGQGIQDLKEKTQPLADELNKWPDLFKDMGDTTQRLVDGINKFINDHPNFIENTSKTIAFIYKVLKDIIGLSWSTLVGALEGIGNAFTKIYEFFTGDWGKETFQLKTRGLRKPEEIKRYREDPERLVELQQWWAKLPSTMRRKIPVPGLAQGSVLNGGDPFLAYLNDQPRGQTNIEAPLDTMVTAFKQALSEGGYSGPTEINLEATGDMSQLIRFLNIKLSDERIRVGNSFVPGY